MTITDDDLLPQSIERWAARTPDRVFLKEVTGHTVSYSEAHRAALTWADRFMMLGVTRGDRVAVMLKNSAEYVLISVGLSLAGAIEVPVNTAYKGSMLGHVLADAAPRVIVSQAEFLPRMAALEGGIGDGVEVVLSLDRPPADDAFPFKVAGVTSPPTSSGEYTRPRPRDVNAILYTSGTTGPSKGVLTTWAQTAHTMQTAFDIGAMTSVDVMYSPFPLFHVSGRNFVYLAAHLGGTCVLREVFSTDAFLDDVREHGCTVTVLLGAMASFLNNRPRRDDDSTTSLKHLLVSPMVPNHEEFRERFGVTLCTGFNMTETSNPINTQGREPANAQTCGRVMPGYQVRLVDEDDREVAEGEPGELVVRTDDPWLLMAGYWRRPEATVEAWRNLWFHTGDILRRDADGNFYYVDRKKDSIRRRGENISSLEIETEVNKHPAVAESAAIAVPADTAEDEVMIVVVRQQGEMLTASDLHAFLVDRLPRFMVPRFIEFAETLPRTPSQRVRKHELRNLGVSDRTWDSLAVPASSSSGVAR